jgi:predicted MFS family arabinose efflux permease
VCIFEYGFILFGLGSLLCVLSWNLPFLIVARSAQAVGASMFISF